MRQAKLACTTHQSACWPGAATCSLVLTRSRLVAPCEGAGALQLSLMQARGCGSTRRAHAGMHSASDLVVGALSAGVVCDCRSSTSSNAAFESFSRGGTPSNVNGIAPSMWVAWSCAVSRPGGLARLVDMPSCGMNTGAACPCVSDMRASCCWMLFAHP
jgi:hypothetical protein